MVNGGACEVWRFSSNAFWENISCLVSAPTFGIGGSALWDKKELQKTSVKKRKMFLIKVKFNLYEICLSYIIYCLLFYIMTILTPFFFSIFVAYLTLGERTSESIGQKYLSWKTTRIQMNVIDQGF